MLIITSDYKKRIEVGTGDMLDAITSTLIVNYPNTENSFHNAITFLKTGNADPADIPCLISEFDEIILKLKSLKPEAAVYDYKHPEKKGPWANGYYHGITSCAELFMTTNGKVLLNEITSILNYANQNHLSISFM